MSKKADKILTRRVEKVLPKTAELAKLMQKKKIRVYLGIDPTGGRLHIGHAIGIKKLMEFAEAGHEAILLFGTGTVMVGDPSLRSTARKMVAEKEIKKNIKNWKKQVAPIVDFKRVKIKKNGQWIAGMSLSDFIKIASNISAVQLFKRESFTRRLEQGNTVWYHETMYPLLQGYDSVVMDVDLEIGGTDQEFNMLIGRELQKKMNNHEKYVLTIPMIMGTDGRQMSKTTGNCVWLDDAPKEMFGKLMSIPDEQILPYFRLVTDVSEAEIKKIENSLKKGQNPKEAKLRLATEVVSIWHGKKAANNSRESFERQFSEGQLPKNIPEIKLSKTKWDSVELLVEAELAPSKSQARRLIQQGGVRLNQEAVQTESITVKNGDILQVGKRKFRSLKV